MATANLPYVLIVVPAGTTVKQTRRTTDSSSQVLLTVNRNTRVDVQVAANEPLPDVALAGTFSWTGF
jgi:hypothetical protein